MGCCSGVQGGPLGCGSGGRCHFAGRVGTVAPGLRRHPSRSGLAHAERGTPSQSRTSVLVGRLIAGSHGVRMTCRAVSTGALGVTNALALLRLLPMSDRDKDVEIPVLRHQTTVLERQLHGEKVRFTAADRALLAARPDRI
jgi:hypothetical protein